MSTSIDYYFKSVEDFSLPEIFEGCTEPCQALASAKKYINEKIRDKDIRESHGELKSSPPTIYGNYYIGEGTVIYNDVTIIGPVYIGKDCEILPGAIIRPYTVMSDGSSVGHGSEVKRGLLFKGSKVASLSFVGDSILGKSARVGSGVITANRKFDQGRVSVKIHGEKHDLGDDFFGCILGDCSRLGANSVTQPGTHIGAHSWIFPLTNVRGFIPGQKRVYNEAKLCFDENEIIELKP